MSNTNQSFQAQQYPLIRPSTPFYIQTAVNGGSPFNRRQKQVMTISSQGIIIDNWVPGNPAQLWRFHDDQSIRLFNNSALVLTANSSSLTSTEQVTLEQESPTLMAAQQWTFDNGQFYVSLDNIGKVYLNYEDSGENGNVNVITYGQSVSSGPSKTFAPNETWDLFPFGPMQAASLNFYILTGMSTWIDAGANPYVLAYQSGVVIEQLDPGSKQQIWTMRGDGTISSLFIGQSLLTAQATGTTADDQPTIESYGATSLPSANQIWNFSGDVITTTVGSPPETVGLNVYNLNLSAGAEVITYPVQQPPGSNEQWFRFSAAPILYGAWFYLKTEMSNHAGDLNTYVLAVSDNNAQAGTQIVIEPWVAGSPGQLWQMQEDGTIISGLNLGLVLATTDDGHKVTLQSLTDASYWTNWYMLPNGAIATGTSGNNFFLDVSSPNSYPVAGDEVVSSAVDDAGENWTAMPYEPSGQWFTIRNAAYSLEGPLSGLLTVSSQQEVTVSAPLGNQLTPTAQAAITQLWRKTIDGYITSATNSQLVLAVGDGGLTVQLIDPANPLQKWSTGYSQMQTVGKKSVPLGTIETDGWILTDQGVVQSPTSTPTTGNLNEVLWYIVPDAMPFGQTTTVSNTSGNTTCYLTLPAKGAAGGFAVTAGDIPEDNTFAMWSYEFPGYLVSAVDNSIVLSLEVADASTTGTSYGTGVVAYPRQTGYQLFQLWTVTEDGLIVSQYNGKALNIPVTSGQPVTVAIITQQGGSPSQLWTYSPGRALETVLQQPHIGFTTNNPSEYNTICSGIGLPGGIREQYQNLSAPLDSYQLQLNLLYGQQYPGLVQELNTEITAATAVRNLFAQATTLYLSLSQAQAMTLSQLITICGFTDPASNKVAPPKKNKSWIWDLVEGIVYTGLNLAGGGLGEINGASFATKNVLPCFANVIAAAFTSGQSYITGRSGGNNKLKSIEQNIYNYEMTVFDLQQGLLNEFEELGNALGRIQALILTDAYKLQEVYTMCTSTGDMSSLYWPSTMAAMDTDEMLKVYSLGVLKTLLPANPDFQINVSMHTYYQKRESEGWQGGNFYINNQDGTQNVYTGVDINATLVSLLQASGANSTAFFTGANGWTVPIEYLNTMMYVSNVGTPASAASLVNIVNCTSMALEVTLNDINYLVASSYQANMGTAIPIAPYGAAQIAGGAYAVADEGGSTTKAKDFYEIAMSTDNGTSFTIMQGTNSVATFGISNNITEQTYDTVDDIPPCQYSIYGLTVYNSFYCNSEIHYGSKGMAFINIFVNIG